MLKYSSLESLFTAIANAIRKKTGDATTLVADNFPEEIEKITTVKEGTTDTTAQSADILLGKTAYADGEKIIGTMTNRSGQTTAWCGYETCSVQTHPVDANQALVTIPNQYGHVGYFDTSSSITGNIANLKAANIRQGIKIGRAANSGADDTNTITGTFTSDATVTSGSQILNGYSAYSKGTLYSGTMTNRGAVAPAALNAGGSYTIPAGYHNGSGKVTAATLAAQGAVKMVSGVTDGSGTNVLQNDAWKGKSCVLVVIANATGLVSNLSKNNYIFAFGGVGLAGACATKDVGTLTCKFDSSTGTLTANWSSYRFDNFSSYPLQYYAW